MYEQHIKNDIKKLQDHTESAADIFSDMQTKLNRDQNFTTSLKV